MSDAVRSNSKEQQKSIDTITLRMRTVHTHIKKSGKLQGTESEKRIEVDKEMFDCMLIFCYCVQHKKVALRKLGKNKGLSFPVFPLSQQDEW